eukprot:163680_1
MYSTPETLAIDMIDNLLLIFEEKYDTLSGLNTQVIQSLHSIEHYVSDRSAKEKKEITQYIMNILDKLSPNITEVMLIEINLNNCLMSNILEYLKENIINSKLKKITLQTSIITEFSPLFMKEKWENAFQKIGFILTVPKAQKNTLIITKDPVLELPNLTDILFEEYDPDNDPDDPWLLSELTKNDTEFKDLLNPLIKREPWEGKTFGSINLGSIDDICVGNRFLSGLDIDKEQVDHRLNDLTTVQVLKKLDTPMSPQYHSRYNYSIEYNQIYQSSVVGGGDIPIFG